MAGTGAFPKVAGDTVFANDYNTIYNSLAAIIGLGSGTSGYGDTLASGTVSEGISIDGAAWVSLKDDILNARKHQLGAGTTYNTLASTFATLTTKLTTYGQIGFADINTFKTTVDTIVTNKDTAATSQLTKITGTSTTYTPSWNGAITHTATVTFASANDARNFFNAGGYIVNDLSSNGSSGSAKDLDWIDILAAGTGASYTAADYRRTAANVVIASETYGSSYADNYFKAWGERVNSTTIKLTMLFDDASAINALIGNPGSGTIYDELVTLNVISAVNYYKSFDAIVSPVPSGVTATAFSVIRTDTQTAGTAPGFGTGGTGGAASASVTRGATNVNEGSSVNFTVSSTNIPAGTMYWTVSRPEDFSTSSGSFSISGAGTGSFSVTPSADALTEGSETFTVSIWSGSGGSGTLYDTSASVTINDTSQAGALPTESITGVGATFTIGSTLTYTVTGQAGTTFSFAWTGIKPDGTNYTGLASGTQTLSGSVAVPPVAGTYSASGAFLTGPGTFTITITFNATGTVRTATTVSEIPATLTYSGLTGLGQDQISLSALPTYGYTYNYTTSATAGATFDSWTGNPPTGTFSGGATTAAINVVNPHAATTVTAVVSMTNCSTKTLTVAVPISTEVFDMSPTTAADGIPLAITFTGGAPNETYDYLHQSDLPGYAYPITVAPSSGWSGTSTGRTDAVLTGSGTKSLPFYGLGLYPANYRLWVKFIGTQNLRYKDFTVTQTGGRVEILEPSPATWSNGSGAGDTSTATTTTVNDLNINETVDITIVPLYYTYTSGFFSNHSTWGWRNFALSNAGTTYSSVSTKGFMYTAGATAPGAWVLWVYFQSTGHYRAYDITVT